MAETIAVACPACKVKLKVPATLAGKRVKCTGCSQPVAVPGAKASPAKAPVAKPAAAPPPPKEESGARPEAPARTADSYKVTWDDETDSDNAAIKVIQEDDNPRCPHCAKLLDPPDAIVCVHCGFNNRTRVKAETKKVYEPDASEWAAHLAPGVLGFIAIVVFIVIDVACIVNMRYWMEGGMLESDDLGFDDRKKMYISPGMFIMMAIFASIFGSYVIGRMAFKRLFVDYMPPEQAMK